MGEQVPIRNSSPQTVCFIAVRAEGRNERVGGLGQGGDAVWWWWCDNWWRKVVVVVYSVSLLREQVEDLRNFDRERREMERKKRNSCVREKDEWICEGGKEWDFKGRIILNDYNNFLNYN